MNLKYFLLLSTIPLFFFKTFDLKAQLNGTGNQYETIFFSHGEYRLSEANKEKIAALVKRADQEHDSFPLIKILAWPDQEYPSSEEERVPDEVETLAEERGEAIKNYLEDDLQRKEIIKVFNMAKRPNFFAEIAKNDEFQTKKDFEEAGPTSTILPNGDVSFTKASKAIVIINFDSQIK